MTTTSAAQQQQKRRNGRAGSVCGWVIIRILILGLAGLCAYGNWYIHKKYVSSSGSGGFTSLFLPTTGGGSSSTSASSSSFLDEGFQGGMKFMLESFKSSSPVAVTREQIKTESSQQHATPTTTAVAAAAAAAAVFQQSSPSLLRTAGSQSSENQNNSMTERKPQEKMMPTTAAADAPPPPPVLLLKESETINTFTFPKHGCLVNTVGPFQHRIHCHFQNLRIDKTKISAQHFGGEPLDTVMGAAEEAEFLTYQHGAFVLQAPLEPLYPSLGHDDNNNNYAYMNNVHSAIQYADTNTSSSSKKTKKKQCDQVWKGLTLFITRYEYVNIYHTMTDWWNTFYSLPMANRMTDDDDNDNNESNNNNNTITNHVENKKVNIVFLDAHPQGNLDPVWRQLFGGNVSFVRHLPFENTCFEEARFVPAGYTSPVYPRQENAILSDRDHAGDFVKHVLNAYNLKHVHRIPGHVVVIDRVPYISHPRSKPENTQRLLGNLRELALNLPNLFPTNNVTVQVVTLVNDTMHDQIAAIRSAHVLIANHGAALAHLLFLDAGAHVVELNCKHGFFPELAKWRRRHDIHHHCQGQDTTQEGSLSPQYWEQNVVSVVRRHAVV